MGFFFRMFALKAVQFDVPITCHLEIKESGQRRDNLYVLLPERHILAFFVCSLLMFEIFNYSVTVTTRINYEGTILSNKCRDFITILTQFVLIFVL